MFVSMPYIFLFFSVLATFLVAIISVVFASRGEEFG